MPTVLLSAAPGGPADDLRGPLAAAGFDVAGHALGSAPPVEFAPLAAAVVEAGDRPDAAAAQTRRWRVELGDQFLPVVWVVPAAAMVPAGLDAGADACVVRPFDPAALVAQVRAGVRAFQAAGRVAARAAEARLLGDQLRKAYAQIDRDQQTARKVRAAFHPAALPKVEAVRFAVAHHARGRAGGDFYDVRRADEHHVAFFAGSVAGSGADAGLLGALVRHRLRTKEVFGGTYRLFPPAEVLADMNRELLALSADDAPFVSAAYGLLDARGGSVSISRAGSPPPVYLPAAGGAAVWHTPGPFLGVSDAAFPAVEARLGPGDRLVVATDAGAELPAAAAGRRALTGQAFADAVARDLLPGVEAGRDFTVLVAETAGG